VSARGGVAICLAHGASRAGMPGIADALRALPERSGGIGRAIPLAGRGRHGAGEVGP
jgi:hypothetical protein